MSDWRKNLRQASFRGVPFKVESHDLDAGRRGVQHEYAQRDKPYTEDLGRKGRQFTIEGFVVGSEYMTERDALIAACEQEGSGELIHPYLGRQVVNCFGCKVRESARDGGMATFSLTFVEAGEVEFPSQKNDAKAGLLGAVDDAIDAAKASFDKRFSVLGQPGFVSDSAIGSINSYADTLSNLSKGASASSSGLAELGWAVKKLKGRALDLIKTPGKLSKQLADSLAILRQIADAPREVFAALAALFGFGSGDKPIPTTTATRRQQAKNAKILNGTISIIATLEATKAAAEIEYESTEDAEVIRDELIENLDAQMEETDDDFLFTKLQAVRSRLIAAVPPPDENLATVAHYELKKTLPSLVVAYEIYESEAFEADLIDRNKVQHPGFVIGGRMLEVLQVDE